MEAVGLQALQRGVGAICFGFEAAVKPEFIGGRGRTDGWLSVTIEDDTAQIVPVNGLRNRKPEVGGTEPGALVLGNGSAGHLIEPHEIGIERRSGIMRELGRTGGQTVEVIAVDGVNQVKFSSLEAQHLDIAIRLNVEPDGIEIRQAVSLGIFFPVVGVAAQKHARSRFVLRNHEWTEHGHFLLGRMRGHDRNLIEKALDSSKRCGKSDGDPVRRNDSGADRAASGPERVSRRGVQRGIHEPLHGKGNVLRGEGASVGKRDAMAKLESDLLAVLRDRPRFRQFGFEFLSVAIDAYQYTARQIADGKRRVVIDQEGIESLWLRMQAEAQLSILGECRAGEKSAAEKKS